MKIENQVCTLEQAKILRQLGVLQQSTFFMDTEGTIRVLIENVSLEQEFAVPVPLTKPIVNHNVLASYTVAELGMMLPDFSYATHHPAKEHGWVCEWSDHDLSCANDTQAKAMAEMLIYLLQENFTTAEEVNSRLAD